MDNRAYIAFHLSPLETDQNHRFDTEISPAGVTATLAKILSNNIDKESLVLAYDQGTQSYDATKEEVFCIIDEIYEKNPLMKVSLLFSILLYNSFASKKLIDEIRKKYSNQIEILIGGQHITQMGKLTQFPGSSFNDWDVDHITPGDGELIIPERLKKHKEHKIVGKIINKSYESLAKCGVIDFRKLPGSSTNKEYIVAPFETMDYSNFHNLEERFTKQKEEAGFTQICRQGQGGPGCSWAANNKCGACTHCALQNIEVMNGLTLEDNIRQQFEEIKKTKADRVFMVDNQFLPFGSKKDNIKWLREMVNMKQALELEYGFSFHYYVYLTETSLLDEEMVSLYNQLGIVEAYIGFDHFHPSGLFEQNKGSDHKGNTAFRRRQEGETFDEKVPSMRKKLDLLRKYGLKIRRGMVMGGSNETKETISAFYEAVEWATDPRQEYIVLNEKGVIDKEKSTIVAIGSFPVEVLPGSENFAKFWRDVITSEKESDGEAKRLMNFLAKNGYRTRDQQLHAQELYINKYSPVGYEAVILEKDRITSLLKQRGLIGYTIDESPDGTSLEGTHNSQSK